MSLKKLGFLALISHIFLLTFHIILARVFISQVLPFTIHFFRMLSASVFFLPLIYKNRTWRKKKFSRLLLITPLGAVNFLGFIWGIQYTTASASQIIYSLIPLLILVISYLILKEKYSRNKVLGVLLGFTGINLIIYFSALDQGATITGSLKGNLVIMIAAVCWTLYILYSKKLSKYFNPIEISGVTVITVLLLSIPLFVWELYSHDSLSTVSLQAGLAFLYMGIVGTFVTQYLFQYALKQLSALTSSLAAYLQPIATTIMAMLLLGEKMTSGFLLGGLFILSGVFLATSYELYGRIKK